MLVKTILAFDFGTKSIGVAIGQQLTKTAYALNALIAKNGVANINEVAELMSNWQPNLLVVGLPLNMDGTKQPITNKAQIFANYLRNYFNIPVEMQDERLSTIEAYATLFEKSGYRGLNKQKVDSQAAVIILQDWFNEN
ncbi:Holliday junction resolvase RuvX [Candidatus Ishikawella capsulata]|uniref:Putative pre-16S rRNA nuclease n=1 Tax=Candidatus Ishikawaella capsulata Mpkobe TaxID=476281 RepID=C5WDJ7_9ENTR|nr:Holliday junction resolvase RuvX [Candidatus Ishikawaella capsulata]BAH83403.1 Holliday junction resolvase-like protein [Candidatus Ishikawaella capsulata Mpkobe]